MLKHDSSQKPISNSELHATSTMNAGAFFDVCCEVRKRRNDMLEDLAVEASLKYRKIPLTLARLVQCLIMNLQPYFTQSTLAVADRIKCSN